MAATRSDPLSRIADRIGESIENSVKDALFSQLKGSALESILLPGRKPAKGNPGETMDSAAKRFEKAVGAFESITKANSPKSSAAPKSGKKDEKTESPKDIAEKTEKVEKLGSAFSKSAESASSLKAQIEEVAGENGKGGIGQLLGQMEMWRKSSEELDQTNKALTKTHQLLGKAAVMSAKDSAKSAIESSTKTIASNMAATASSGAKGVAGAAGNAMMFPPPVNAILLASGIAAVVGALALAAKTAAGGGAKAGSAPSAPAPPAGIASAVEESEKKEKEDAEKAKDSAEKSDEESDSGDTLSEKIAKGVSDGIAKSGGISPTDATPAQLAESAAQKPANTVGAGDNRNDPGRTEEIVSVLNDIRSNTDEDRGPEIRAHAVDAEGNRIRTRKEAEEEERRKAEAGGISAQDSEGIGTIASESTEQTRLLRAIAESISGERQPEPVLPAEDKTEAQSTTPEERGGEPAPEAPEQDNAGIGKLAEAMAKNSPAAKVVEGVKRALDSSPTMKLLSRFLGSKGKEEPKQQEKSGSKPDAEPKKEPGETKAEPKQDEGQQPEKTGVARLLDNIKNTDLFAETKKKFMSSPAVKAALGVKKLMSGVFGGEKGKPKDEGGEASKAQERTGGTPEGKDEEKGKDEKSGIARLLDNLKKTDFLAETKKQFMKSPAVKMAMGVKNLMSGVFGGKKDKPKDGPQPSSEGETAKDGESKEAAAEEEMSILGKLNKFRENMSKENIARMAKERLHEVQDRLQKKLGLDQDLKDSAIRMAQNAKEQVAKAKDFAKDKLRHVQKLAMGKARMMSDKLEVVSKVKGNAMKMASDAAAFVKEKAQAMMTIAIRGAKAAASMVQRAMMLPFPLNAIAIGAGAALVAGGVLLAKKMLSGDSGGEGVEGGGDAKEGGEKEKEEQAAKGGATPEEAKRLAKEERKEQKRASGPVLTSTFWKMTVAAIITLLKKIADKTDSSPQPQQPGTSGNGQGVMPSTGQRSGPPGNGSTQSDVSDSFAHTRYAPNMTRNM